jgi:hypothetical protein
VSRRHIDRVIHHGGALPPFLQTGTPYPSVNCELVANEPAATLCAVPMTRPNGADNAMRKKPTPTQDSTNAPLKERRAALQGKGAANPLKRLKGALGRPVALQWRDGQPHVVLVERRSGAARLDRLQAHLCAELRALLLAQEADETSKLLRYLVLVHDTLTRKGWEGVSALPAAALAKAIMQADMLAKEDSSPALTQLVERLRLAHAAAVARDQAKQAKRTPGDDNHVNTPHRVEVTEGSYKEFEDLERSWTRTMPSDLAPLYADS